MVLKRCLLFCEIGILAQFSAYKWIELKKQFVQHVSNLKGLIAGFDVRCAAKHATLVGSDRRRNYLMNQYGTRSVALDRRIQFVLHSVYSRGDLCPHNIQISHRPNCKATERFPALRTDSTLGCICDLLHRNSILYQIVISCSSGGRLLLWWWNVCQDVMMVLSLAGVINVTLSHLLRFSKTTYSLSERWCTKSIDVEMQCCE